MTPVRTLLPPAKVPTLRAADVPLQPWRNGGGTTRELMAWPHGGADPRVRVALADIARDGPFSSFPGVTRWFAPVHGGPVTLGLPDGRHTLGAGSAPLRFDGGDAPLCTLPPDAPALALNLMLRGAVGCLLAAEPGVPAPAGWPWRCLFAVQAGELHGEGGFVQTMPEHTLAGPLPAGAWRFTAHAAGEPGTARRTAHSTAHPAFWLVADLEEA